MIGSLVCLLLTLPRAPTPNSFCSLGTVGTYDGAILCCDSRCVVCAARGCISANYRAFGGSRQDSAASSNISGACCLTSLSRRACRDKFDTLCLIPPPPPPALARLPQTAVFTHSGSGSDIENWLSAVGQHREAAVSTAASGSPAPSFGQAERATRVPPACWPGAVLNQHC